MAPRKKKNPAIVPPPKREPVELSRLADEAASAASQVASDFDATVDSVKDALTEASEFLEGADLRESERKKVKALIEALEGAKKALADVHGRVCEVFEKTDGFEGAVQEHFESLKDAAQFLEHIADPYRRNPLPVLERDQAALHFADVVLGETG